MEYKGWKVKQKPYLWQFIPWLASYAAQAIYPNIYVSRKVYKDITSKSPNPRFIAVLEHEKRHFERQKELGLLKFGVNYLFCPKFRFQEELVAIKETMKYLKQRGLTFDIDRSAHFLSSWLYLWMVSFEKAKLELKEAWNKV